MGRTDVIVSAEQRNWLVTQQVWREGVYIVGDRTYGGDGKHYLDVVSDKLEPGIHGVREIVVESGRLRFRTPPSPRGWSRRCSSPESRIVAARRSPQCGAS